MNPSKAAREKKPNPAQPMRVTKSLRLQIPFFRFAIIPFSLQDGSSKTYAIGESRCLLNRSSFLAEGCDVDCGQTAGRHGKMPQARQKPTAALSYNLGFLHMASFLLDCENRKRKKGGELMKNLKANLSMLLVVGILGTSGVALAADNGVISKQELTPGGYCHEKFPAIRPSTLD